MPYPSTTLLFWTLPTFAVLTGLGVVLVLLIIHYRERSMTSTGKIVDVSIGGLAGSLVLARVFHVVLNWGYFSAHNSEIVQFPAGGLNWHGAVIGAIAGIVLAGWWRKAPVMRILDTGAIGLPLMMFMVWWGCGAAACAYGAEIQNLSQYPSWLVWEERDIYGLIYPRYATQPVGMMIATGLLLLSLLFFWRGWFAGRRFGILLALVSLSMFFIGFLRGDTPAPWLDLAMIFVAFVLIGITSYDRTHHLRLSGTSAQHQP